MTLDLDKSSWETVRFGEVVKNTNENVRDPAAEGIDRIIALEHLDGGELEISRWGSTADSTTFSRRVRPGQTLFGKRRAYQRKVAYSEFDAITSGDILTFDANPDRLLPALLPFLVQSGPFFAHALGTSAGSLSPRTNWGDLSKFEFSLPRLPEQRRLAHLLWAAEHHRRALRANLATLPTIRAVTAGSLGSAATVRVSAVAEIRNGQTFPKKYQGQSDGDLPFFKVSDLDRVGNERWLTHAENWISETDVVELRARVVEPGDVITVRVGAALRAERRRMVRSRCLVDDNQLIIHPTKVDPRFLWARLSEVPLAASRNDGVVPSINQAIVGAVEIPDITRGEQIRAADEYLAYFDAGDAIKAEINTTNSISAAILREVFG